MSTNVEIDNILLRFLTIFTYFMIKIVHRVRLFFGTLRFRNHIYKSLITVNIVY